MLVQSLLRVLKQAASVGLAEPSVQEWELLSDLHAPEWRARI